MKRSTLNAVLNLISLNLFAALAASGLVMAYRLPHRSGQSISILGMSRHEWGDLHLLFAFLFIAVIVGHLLLHKSWISAVFSRREHSFPAALRISGIAALLLTISIAIAPAVAPLQGSNAGQEQSFQSTFYPETDNHSAIGGGGAAGEGFSGGKQRGRGYRDRREAP